MLQIPQYQFISTLKGLFDINNEFSLQISNVGDDFTSGSTTIKTIQDFYTPLMTTSLPNLDAGVYKLRIKASLGLQAGGNIDNVNDYSEIFSEELDLTVVDSQINSPSTINSPSVETNANFFECLDSTTLPRIEVISRVQIQILLDYLLH